MRGSFDYLRPRSLEEAQECKARAEGTRYVAGGTDLLVRMKEGKERPTALVSLRRVPELSGVQHDQRGGLRIGTTTLIADALADAQLGARYPVLAQAMSTMGCVQIRNLATVGGNLCSASPCADLAPPLLVLGARLVVRRAESGREEEWPLEDFFHGPRQTRLGPHDLATAVLVDAPSSARAIFFKKTRVQMDLALASVAVLLELDGTTCRKARIAAGSVAPTPRRLTAVERLLEGEVLSRDVVQQAADVARESVAPICDVRAGDDYRRRVTGVFVRRALETLLAGERP